MDPLNTVLNAIEILLIIVGGFFLKSYLPTYFAEKGKNLATKEDIKDITDKVESIRLEYARRQHKHEIAFGKEFEILSEVWNTLVDLRIATQGLRPLLDYVHPNETDEERKVNRLQKFAESFEVFASTVVKNQPFYPEDVYESLFQIMMISREEADEYSHRDPNKRPLDSQYWDNALNNQKKILAMVDQVCEKIRNRIAA
jgi:uncharacterized membrane protein